MIRKLTITLHNSIEDLTPEFYKTYIPKPMPMNGILELVDKDLDNFEHFACQ